MSDAIELLAESVAAIKSDQKLRECFVRILKFGTSTQQVRVSLLKRELETLGAPAPVMNFVRLLADDKIAHLVLAQLEN